ncbi:MAG: DUF669 domain-containing protein [Ruminococcus sp.]|nr:DUF669 domain-containing protein [Ruminococcus sp.]
MGFKTNYDDVQDYSLIPVGEYEVIIQKIEERTTQNGATGLNMTLVIRNDVEQKCQNRCIFHTLWKRREPTQADMQVQGYGFNQIMQLAKAAGLTDGKEYENVYELCGDLVNRVIRVKVVHEEYNGKTNERVHYINASQFPDCNHKFKETVSADTVAPKKQEQFAGTSMNVSGQDFEEIIGDDDLPF